MDHRVIGVLGASGGLGASTLSVALGARAARRWGVTACVDGEAWGGGLDVTACLEHLPGLRWADLAGAAGEFDGAALLTALPTQEGVAVLSAGGSRDSPRGVGSPGVEVRAVTALGRLCALTVVDLGRGVGLHPGAGLLESCSDVLVLAGTSARQLADAVAAAHLVARGAPPGSVGLVLRTPRRDVVEPEEVALRLDLPLVAVLPDDAAVVTDADRGRVPGTRPSGRLTTVADRLLDWLAVAEAADDLGVSA